MRNPLKKKAEVKKSPVAAKPVSIKDKVLAEYNKGKSYAQLAEDHEITTEKVEEIVGAIAHEYVPEELLQSDQPVKKAKK